MTPYNGDWNQKYSKKVDGDSGRYRFSHKLVQEAIAHGLSEPDRKRYHTRIAEGLERLYGGHADAHAGELAGHFYRAGGSTDKLVHYAGQAGMQAENDVSLEVADRFFRWCIESKRNETLDEQLADIYSKSIPVLWNLSKFEEGLTRIYRVFTFYEAKQDIPSLLDTAWFLGEFSCYQGVGFHRSIVSYIDRALELAAGVDTMSVETMVHAAKLRWARFADNERFEREMAAALRKAEKQNEPALKRLVHAYWALDRQFAGMLRIGLRHNRLVNSAFPMDAYHNILQDASIADLLIKLFEEPADAALHLRKAMNTADRLHSNRLRASSYMHMQGYLLFRGDWERSREFCDKALYYADLVSVHCPDRYWILCYRAILEHELGEFSAGGNVLERFLTMLRNPHTPAVIDYVASLTRIFPRISRIKGSSIQDLANTSARRFDRVFTHVRGKPWQGHEALGLMAAVAGDRKEVEAQYRFLTANLNDLGNYLAHSLGFMAGALGDYAAAREHYELAYETRKRVGFLPELAWICLDYAEALVNLDGEGNKEKSYSLLNEGLSLTSQLGMKPLHAIITHRLDELSRRGRNLNPGGLTDREIDVIRLMARGMTDQEIAWELNISARTVGTHARHIYEKIGSSNRAAAVSYAASHGLTLD